MGFRPRAQRGSRAKHPKSERRFAAGQERSWGPSAAGGPGVARAVHQALCEGTVDLRLKPGSMIVAASGNPHRRARRRLGLVAIPSRSPESIQTFPCQTRVDTTGVALRGTHPGHTGVFRQVTARRRRRTTRFLDSSSDEIHLTARWTPFCVTHSTFDGVGLARRQK